MGSTVDEELKQLQNSYSDKQQVLLDSKRKKGGNLLVADLNDVLTDAIMSNVTVHDTDYLKTVFIAVPKTAQESFESTIYQLGDKIVGYGGRCYLLQVKYCFISTDSHLILLRCNN